MLARRSRAGFTLVEVLVALFVVALGMAGALALHAHAARSGGEAARLADGVQLASSLAQRMRANPVGMALPDAANPYLHFDVEAGQALPPAACYGPAACTPSELASFDLFEASAALSSRFPGGRMLVCRDAGTPGPAGLLPWACAGGPGSPVAIKLGWPANSGEPAAPAVLLLLAEGTP